ncbi:aminotransferase class I/II-fold pyridoxal phosphate-dependent enzyme [Candidatus Peregrinibacteria bacterium]|nr:aminotransferase class I/II-fold pyridoxal phosphate-dependent enzyme [Candidatus Peregrinibacteria bacterium]
MEDISKKTFDITRGAPPMETIPKDVIAGNGDEEVPGISDVIRENPLCLAYKGSNVAGHNFKGYGPLRETLAAQHKVKPEQIFVRNGGMDAMHFVLHYLRYAYPDIPISVATEVPTYDRFPRALNTFGFEWVGIPLTQDGLDMDELRSRVNKKYIDLFYRIYEGQNPSSYSYSDKEMQSQTEELAGLGAIIMDDGAYHNLTYGRKRNEITEFPDNYILQRNFTKEVSPGLKCGYLVIPENMVEDFDYIVRNLGLNPVYPVQAWYNAFINSTLYPGQIDYLRDIFGPRAMAVLDALNECSPEAEYNRNLDSGYFLDVNYPSIPERDTFVDALAERGIKVERVNDSYPPESLKRSKGAIRIPFATLKEDEIEEVCRRIAEVHSKIAV